GPARGARRARLREDPDARIGRPRVPGPASVAAPRHAAPDRAPEVARSQRPADGAVPATRRRGHPHRAPTGRRPGGRRGGRRGPGRPSRAPLVCWMPDTAPLLLSIFVSDLLPVFAIAAVGFVLARYLGVDARPVARLTFHALVPSLVFNVLTSSTVGGVAFV